MISPIVTRTYEVPPFNEKEILRYAGCREGDGKSAALLRECVREAEDKTVYKVCYRELPITIYEDVCDLGAFSLRSLDLGRNLNGCKRVIVFAATVGVQIDRLIIKYGRLSPAKALMFQAIGAERIEALCEVFCRDIAREQSAELRPGFSPGYGDLPLSVQKDVFTLLDCSRRIGLTLNDSLLMSPSKSVTAFLGIV